MTRPLIDSQLAQLEEQFLAAMPPEGAIGNAALRNALGWEDDLYEHICSRLVEAGRLAARGGRSGSVRQVVRSAAPRGVIELDLYQPIITTLRLRWVPEHRIQDFIIHQTANQGRRDTGGRWTRPDVTLGSYRAYKYVPGIQLELTTFEVKSQSSLDVTAVYEALAHRRAGHYAFVLAYVPRSEHAALKSVLDRLVRDAAAHGIGFVIMGDVDTYETWDFAVEAERHEPDPAELNHFIETQTSQEFKDKIIDWCRTL